MWTMVASLNSCGTSPLIHIDCKDGIRIRYRTDGKLFNARHLQAIMKVKETVIRDCLFADDCALNASTEREMQTEIYRFLLSL